MTEQTKYERLLKRARKYEYNYTIAWMKVMAILDENKEFESSKRNSYCKGFLGYKS